MSLLLERPELLTEPPRLEGRERLRAPGAACRIKGVMFAGRKHFLTQTAGEDVYRKIVDKLTPATRLHIKTPLASAWVDFEALIELDRVIHETLSERFPNVLALIGAASAELGIGRLYKALDSAELVKFFEDSALFHDQYQKFGRVRFEKVAGGGHMIYTDYPCYSPIYCASAVGYFLESMLRHGAKRPKVTETRCQCRGEKSCTFEMSWA